VMTWDAGYCARRGVIGCGGLQSNSFSNEITCCLKSLAFAAEPRAFNWQTNRLRPSCREFSTVKEDQ
jgi:hypothetical protein